MKDRSRRLRMLLLASLLSWLPPVIGCGWSTPDVSQNVGTTFTVGLPESQPPVVSKELADKIKPGMAQQDVLSILQAAAQDTPSAKSSVDTAVLQGKLNSIRYDLTVTQGKRTLVLAFKDNKLVDKSQEGLE